MRRKSPYIAAIVVVLALTLAFTAVWAALRASRENDRRIEAARVERIRQVNRINGEQCAALRNIYTLLRSTVKAGDQRLENIEYYRQHPLELADAHAANQAILLRFRTPPCPSDVSIPEDR